MNAVVAMTPDMEQTESTRIALAMIQVKPGFNPRTFIDEDSSEFLDFCKTVQEHGVIQPIVVRPLPEGGYSIIAGERRYRAAKKVGLTHINAVIKDVDESTAKVLALIENAQRMDVSPIEEADTCHELMDQYNGNHEEVMALLGWNKQKLDRRLLLVHAANEVRAAFLKGVIPMGMVELLAGIPAESQVGTMNSAIEKNLTVADLKARLDAATEHLQLGRAIFDTSHCNNACPNNSTSQLGLFSESITEGRCMNRACYGEKTKVALAQKKVDLADQYNAVFLDTEKQAGSFGVVMATGPQGVGVEQYNQCKGCANFGAYLSSAPGQEGRVNEEVCFDKSCMDKKIADFHASPNEGDEAGQEAKGSSPTKSGAKPSKAKAVTGKTAKPKASTTATPGRVVEAVDSFYRTVATEIASNQPAVRLAIAAYSMWLDTQMKFDLSPFETEELPFSGRGRDEMTAAFYHLPTERLAQMVSEMALFIAGHRKDEYTEKAMVKTAVALVKVTDTDLVGRFELTADFLKAHTKAGIDSLLNEAKTADGQTFPDWYNEKEKSDKAYKRLIGMKTEDLIAEVMGSGFDFSQFVPSVVSGRL